MGNRRRGFTLAELIVGVVVMIVTLGVATMSLRSTDQTARREAERLTAYINRQKDKAERINANFTLDIKTSSITVTWLRQYKDPPFELSDGCSYSNNLSGLVDYNASQRRFQKGGTITVQDAKGENYYVIIEPPSKGGRIRLSDTPPD